MKFKINFFWFFIAKQNVTAQLCFYKLLFMFQISFVFIKNNLGYLVLSPNLCGNHRKLIHMAFDLFSFKTKKIWHKFNNFSY